MSIELTVCGRTDVGRLRTTNEDAWDVADLTSGDPFTKAGRAVTLRPGPRGLLLSLSDGVGGAQAGEVASALALRSLRRTLRAEAALGEPAATLRWGVDQANREVWMAAQEPGREGMAATLTAVLVRGTHAYVAQVGDSRAYVLRGDRLLQLTRDQASGELHKLLQAVGQKPEVEVALGRLDLRRDDRLLVCSDGLWGKLEDPQLRRLIEAAPSLDAACARLVDAANERGGEDNITLILALLGGEGVPAARPGEDPQATFETLRSYDPLAE